MEHSEYQNMGSLEDTHWWYVSTHRAILQELGKLSPGARVLDAGCGTGGLLSLLPSSFPGAGFDASLEGLRRSGDRKGVHGRVALGYIETIPFQSNYFDAVTCIDVIYHSKVQEESAAMREIFRVLRPGGVLILQVPAFECLRGGHDEAVHTRKRYLPSDMELLLRGAGFRVTRFRFRFPWLFLPAYFLRKHTRGSRKSDLQPVNERINSFLLRFSGLFDSPGFDWLPFGTSLFALAEK